ncbi:MAG: hypothetical protein LC808_37635 [Actinobacteria bacterium]|nr:hypothetical protein [Actinomycetota bacterium]
MIGNVADTPMAVVTAALSAAYDGKPIDFVGTRARLAHYEDQLGAWKRDERFTELAEYFLAVNHGFKKVVDHLEADDWDSASFAFRAALQAGASLPSARRRMAEAKAKHASAKRRVGKGR